MFSMLTLCSTCQNFLPFRDQIIFQYIHMSPHFYYTHPLLDICIISMFFFKFSIKCVPCFIVKNLCYPSFIWTSRKLWRCCGHWPHFIDLETEIEKVYRPGSRYKVFRFAGRPLYFSSNILTVVHQFCIQVHMLEGCQSQDGFLFT